MAMLYCLCNLSYGLEVFNFQIYEEYKVFFQRFLSSATICVCIFKNGHLRKDIRVSFFAR